VEEGMEPLIDELRREEEGIMRADRALKKIERNMIARGYKIEEIQAITGLSSEEIEPKSKCHC
jgi:SOS response regulatory protein OraA/RecX